MRRSLMQTLVLLAAMAGQALAAERNPRVVFITDKDSKECTTELARLRRPNGDFARMRSIGWRIGSGEDNDVQVVERDLVAELVEQLDVRSFPTVACIDKGEVVRFFRAGCTTPLDMWTFGWLAKGVDERPATSVPEAARVASTGSYPLRGNHWSIDGDWNPSREKVVSHLRGPNHAIYMKASWKIESWSIEELRSLHDNLHENEMGGVSYASRSGSSGSVNQFSATRKILGH